MGFLQDAIQSVSNPGFGADAIPKIYSGGATMGGYGGGTFDMQGRRVDIPDNIFQQLGEPQADVGSPTLQAETAHEAPQGRTSILDVIGGLADTFAQIGGSAPMYQPAIDAELARRQAAEDRPLQVRLNQQKVAKGDQDFTKGDIEIDDARRTQIGQAVKGLSYALQKGGPESVMRAWPMMAAQLKLPPEQASALGQALSENPANAIGMLNEWLNASDKAKYGLNPVYYEDEHGKLQIGQMNTAGGMQPIDLHGGTPVDPGKVIDTGNAQVVIGGKSNRPLRIMPKSGGLATGEVPIVDANGNVTGARALPGSRQEFDQNAVTEKSARALEGDSLTKSQRGVMTTNYRLIPVVQRQLKTVRALAEQMDKEGTFFTGSVGGLMPGALSGSTAQKYDKALKSLQLQMRKFTRTPGEGSFSDYEGQMQEASLPSRWGDSAGRKQSIDDLDALLNGTAEAYGEILGVGSSAPAPRGNTTTTTTRRTLTPRAPAGGGWGKMTVGH